MVTLLKSYEQSLLGAHCTGLTGRLTMWLTASSTNFSAVI